MVECVCVRVCRLCCVCGCVGVGCVWGMFAHGQVEIQAFTRVNVSIALHEKINHLCRGITPWYEICLYTLSESDSFVMKSNH